LSMKEMLLTNQADEQTSIKGGDDFRKKISEIPHQTSKEELILLQVFRTFLKAKPELQPILCELAEIIVAAFKNKDIRPTLSTTLEGLSTELLIQVATEKYRENERKDLKKVAAEMLVDTHPVKRVKTMEELRMEIDNIPHKTPAEERVLQTLATAAQQTEEVSFFDLASRILTAFYHTENRPNIGQCLADITPEEIHDIAIEMLAPQRSPSGRVSMERVQQMLQESQPKPNQSRPTPSTKSLPRPAAVSSDEQSIAGLSRGKEEAVTRK